MDEVLGLRADPLDGVVCQMLRLLDGVLCGVFELQAACIQLCARFAAAFRYDQYGCQYPGCNASKHANQYRQIVLLFHATRSLSSNPGNEPGYSGCSHS